MARYVAHVDCPASAADAYAYLADFTTLADWDPGVAESRVSDAAGGGAPRYRVMTVLLGLRTELMYEVLRAEPPAAGLPGRFEVRAETRDFVSHDVIEVAATGRGCTVRYDADLRPKGIRRLAEPGFWALFQVIGRRAEAGLRQALARLPHTAP